MRYFTRALSSRDGCRGVLGLFDDPLRPRAPRFAPALVGAQKGWEMLVCYKPLAQKNLIPQLRLDCVSPIAKATIWQ